MDRETARQEIRGSWRQILERMTGRAKVRVNGEQSYICPLCGNGSGSSGDGLTRNPKSADGNGLKCFKCGFSGDIIDLYQQHTGTDYNTAFSLLAQEIGIKTDQGAADPAAFHGRNRQQQTPERPAGGFFPADGVNIPFEEKSGNPGGEEPQQADYTGYYEECCRRLADPEAVSYLKGRGISLETAAAYQVGFDPAADPAGAPGATGDVYKAHPCPRIIIPTSKGHYIARSIDGATPKQFQKLNPNTAKGADSPSMFNGAGLYADNVREVFITEGAFDALSVIEAGGQAVALNSTANAEKLISQLEQNRTEATLILCLDNDNAGKVASETIKEGLRRLRIPFITGDICGEEKDPNAALTADRAAFTLAVEEARKKAQEITAGPQGDFNGSGYNFPTEPEKTAGGGAEEARPDNVAKYIDSFMTEDIARFREEIKTGYSNLDAEIGGLYPGLYCVAAISSIGKTTFMQQAADQIAAGGNDVIFFSLEMSRLEMVSKSIARITAQQDMKKAVTSLAIRRGYLPGQVLKAAETYKMQAGERLSIVEGNFSCDIYTIGDYVRSYIRRTGTRPVVIIDYLQIITPVQTNGRAQGTKEAVDMTITELKRLSRELNITIIVISSLNRVNYLQPVSFESLKESGMIEYSADVIFGLQLACLNEDIFEKEGNLKKKRERISEAKAENPRKIRLSCLKNRYGKATFDCCFEYFPANDLFIPAADFSFITDGRTRKAVKRL